jgi:hypothetical protein
MKWTDKGKVVPVLSQVPWIMQWFSVELNQADEHLVGQVS